MKPTIIAAQPGWTLRWYNHRHPTVTKEPIIAWSVSSDGYVWPITVDGLKDQRQPKPDDVTRLIVPPDDGATYDLDDLDGCWRTLADAETIVTEKREAAAKQEAAE